MKQINKNVYQNNTKLFDLTGVSGFLKECGQKLGEVSPRGLTAVFDRLRHVLHEADLDKRVKYMIEVMFQVRKAQAERNRHKNKSGE